MQDRGDYFLSFFLVWESLVMGCDLVWAQLLEVNLVQDRVPESRVQHLPCWHLTLRVGGACRAGHPPVKSSGGKALGSSLPGLGVLVSVLPSSW